MLPYSSDDGRIIQKKKEEEEPSFSYQFMLWDKKISLPLSPPLTSARVRTENYNERATRISQSLVSIYFEFLRKNLSISFLFHQSKTRNHV